MTMAEAFDEWQRRYEENPEQFGNDMTNMIARQNQEENSTASEYGLDCATLLQELMKNGPKAWQE